MSETTKARAVAFSVPKLPGRSSVPIPWSMATWISHGCAIIMPETTMTSRNASTIRRRYG